MTNFLSKMFNKKRKRRSKTRQIDGYEGLIASKELKAPATEAYRVLRTNLHYAGAESELQVLMFTSAGPGEGKSTTSANTAVVKAQAGKRVVIVDCDLRKPSLHRIFGIDRAVGVTNVLVENWNIEDVLVETKIPNLWLIPSGPLPPNPAELLGSKRFAELVNNLKEKFDVIIIDSPPTIAVTDAGLISSQADGVVLVCNTKIARPEWAQKAKRLLEAAKANIVGVVLNKIDTDSDDYYYYYYYYGEGIKDNEKKSDNL